MSVCDIRRLIVLANNKEHASNKMTQSIQLELIEGEGGTHCVCFDCLNDFIVDSPLHTNKKNMRGNQMRQQH